MYKTYLYHNNTFNKKRFCYLIKHLKKCEKLRYGWPRTSFGRQYDYFCFLVKTLIMTSSVQINSFLNELDFHLLALVCGV